MSGCVFPYLASSPEDGRIRRKLLSVAVLSSVFLHGFAFGVLDLMLRRSFVTPAAPNRSMVAASLVVNRHARTRNRVRGAKVIELAQDPVRLEGFEEGGGGRDYSAVDRHEGGGPTTQRDDGGAVFVQSSLLTVRPKALTEISIDESTLNGDTFGGRAVLALRIDRAGIVVSVDIKSSDYLPSATEAIVDGFRRLRFSPGLVGETPVNSTMEIEVAYGYPLDSAQ